MGKTDFVSPIPSLLCVAVWFLLFCYFFVSWIHRVYHSVRDPSTLFFGDVLAEVSTRQLRTNSILFICSTL
jgi:hypothetical protein